MRVSEINQIFKKAKFLNNENYLSLKKLINKQAC